MRAPDDTQLERENAVKISLDSGRPEGEWTSWNEAIGTGDGARASFPLPCPPVEARGLSVTRDFATVEPDGRLREFTADGKTIINDEPDGWKLVLAGDSASVEFDRPPRFGARVAVAILGREIGDAFQIYAMDSTLSKKLDEKMPKGLKTRKREELAVLPEVQEMCRLAFIELVQDWKGITDEKGNPLPCDEKMKGRFLDRTDVVSFGLFVMERARTIQRERLSGFETSIPN